MNTSRRSIHYPGVGSRFHLPDELWNQTVSALRYYGQFQSEGLVYWGGIVGAGGETIVTSLLKLNHLPQGGCVRPTSKEMRVLLRTLRERDEKLVAQIHSHPGQAFHSPGDSLHATSFHRGFISLVLPNFGSGVQSLFDCAVYEFRGSFEAVTQSEIAERFVVQPTIVDLLPSIPQPVEEPKETLWNALSKKLKSIGFRKQ